MTRTPENSISDRLIETIRDFHGQVAKAIMAMSAENPGYVPRPAEYNKAAERLATMGRMSWARDLYSIARAQYPEEARLLIRQADLEYEYGDQAAALQLVAQAQALPEGPYETAMYRGISCAMQHQSVAAAEYFEKAVAIKPQNIHARIRLIRTYMDDEKFDLAKAQCEQAIALEPNKPEHYVNAAICDIKLSNFHEAFERLGEVIQLFADNKVGEEDGKYLEGALKLQRQIARVGVCRKEYGQTLTHALTKTKLIDGPTYASMRVPMGDPVGNPDDLAGLNTGRLKIDGHILLSREQRSRG